VQPSLRLPYQHTPGSPLEKFEHNLRDPRSAKERWYDDFAVAADVFQICEQRHLTFNRAIVKQKYKDLHLNPADQAPDGADSDMMSRATQRADHATEGFTSAEMCRLGDDLSDRTARAFRTSLLPKTTEFRGAVSDRATKGYTPGS
jgi:hypothetical protein